MQFEFTINEINLILGSLAKQPYEVVFELVEKIKLQAQSQLHLLNTDGEEPEQAEE